MKKLLQVFFILQFSCSIKDKDLCNSNKFKSLEKPEFEKYFLTPETSVIHEKRIFYTDPQVRLVEITKKATHTGFCRLYLEFSNNEVLEIGKLQIDQLNKILVEKQIEKKTINKIGKIFMKLKEECNTRFKTDRF